MIKIFAKNYNFINYNTGFIDTIGLFCGRQNLKIIKKSLGNQINLSSCVGNILNPGNGIKCYKKP